MRRVACLEKVALRASRAVAAHATRFAGHAMLHALADEGGAFVGTNQSLDCLKKNILTVLRPGPRLAAFRGKAASRAIRMPGAAPGINGLYRKLS